MGDSLESAKCLRRWSLKGGCQVCADYYTLHDVGLREDLEADEAEARQSRRGV